MDDPAPPPPDAPDARVRAQRRWWYPLLIVAGVLALVAVHLYLGFGPALHRAFP